jgi:hypothetical protein
MGGEPASAEWFGRRIIGDCGDCGMAALITTAHILYNKNDYGIVDVCIGSVMLVWFGRWPVCDSVTVRASRRHRSTDLICI